LRKSVWLPGKKVLSTSQIDKLMEVRKQFGFTNPMLTCKGPQCNECGICDTEQAQSELDQKQQRLWQQSKSASSVPVQEQDISELVTKITEEVVRRVISSNK
jgi:hypothetical protein